MIVNLYGNYYSYFEVFWYVSKTGGSNRYGKRLDGQRNLKKRYGFIMPIYGSEEEAQKDTFLSFPEGSIGRYQSYKFQVMKPNLLTPGEWRRDLLHEKIVEAEQRYVFVENKHKVAVGDRLKKYNLLTTLVWDYMEQSDYSYHGVIRSWS